MTTTFNPFNLPNINKLNDTNNMFLPKNLNNNGNNKNIFPFPNNTGINNNNSFFNTNNQTNGTINKKDENPFLKTTQDPFKNNPFSNQNSSLSTKPEEKNKSIFPFLTNNDKNLKNENKGNIFGSNNMTNIVNTTNNQFFLTTKSQTMNSSNFFKAPEKTISPPQMNLNTQEEKPKIENSTSQINPFNSNNFNPFNNNNNKNDLNNANLFSQKIEKEKEKKENNNIFISGANKIEKNNFNHVEFSSSPKKQLEIIKEEDEELKLKKESSTLGVLTENLFNNGDNDSQEKLKDKINNKNENIALSNFNSTIINNNENEHKLKNNKENNLNNINEVKKENEIINEEKEPNEEKQIINEEKKENENIEENNKKENIENNNIENNINNEKENKKEEENNNENYNIIKLEKIINISDNEEEISKIIEENNEQVDNIINEYHLNIITDMIDLNINEFKNKISQFINFSAEKINGIKILNDICGKIKEKLFINYNIMIEKQNININEYNILKEYDQKLDYVISLQNKIINDLKNVNNELKQNINSFKDENNQNKNEINEKELNDNINNTNENIKNLENVLENHFNKNAIENLNDINIPDFKENDNFFSIIQSIYTPLKEVNKAFEQILMESSSYNEKNY